MKVKEFYEPVFMTTVLFMTGTKPHLINEYLKKHKYNEIDIKFFQTTAGSVSFLDQTDDDGRVSRMYLVIVEDKKGFYTLLHETHHLATHIMNDRGIPVNESNDEVPSFLQDYWFRTLWRFMNNTEVVLERKKK